MNNIKEYIEVKNNGQTYDVYIVMEDEKLKLSNKNKKIMIDILEKFNYQKVSNDTLIFTDFKAIAYQFRAEQKRRKKKINRKKSRNIIASAVLVASLGVGLKGLYDNMIKSTNDETETNIETQITNIPKESNENNDSVVLATEKVNTDEDINTKTFTAAVTMAEGENEFDYEYQDIGDEQALTCSSQYMEVFKKYEKIYGIDANLLCAIGAQESSGVHRQYSVNGYATGLMGIENVWAGGTIRVFNFNTNDYETIKVDYSKITDLDYNVKIGAAIFQNYFYSTLKNNTSIDKSDQLAFSIQKYNMGPGNMAKILNLGDNWIDNREMISAGDQKYFEHVLSRLDNDTIIDIRLDDGSYHSTKLVNKAIENKYVR